jgi:hypothetical protein
MMQFDLDYNHRATAEMRILLATINMTLMDACIAPNKHSPSKAAMDAHDFIWGDRLETFLHYTDMEPGWFRARLTEAMEDRSGEFQNGFYAQQRRAFRQNRRLYARLRNANQKINLDEEENETECVE